MSNEPASLSRGTEVSAKYKGAFCEATVKEVKKLVKCKVNFKGKGIHTISDEFVRSSKPLKISSTVEAKHPDGTYSEGTIVKLTDASQYTVVFDDGDERTLRRTSLCLKGEKHYDETETLNHLPLTNPEYFGTPVSQGSGSGKKGRKRRRPSASSVDDELDDDISDMNASKKLNFGGPNVGKVVFIESGERRRNMWIPALVVPRSLAEDYDLSSTDQSLVRSFKDGKFYVAQLSEMRDFSEDSELLISIEKGELPGNKQANQIALQYLDTGKLPWDMQLDLHNESAEDDEEYHSRKEKFLAALYRFMNDRGSPIEQVPLFGNNPIDLCRLYHVVKEIGGMNEVTKQMKWPNIVSQLNFTISSPASSATVKTLYRKYLYPFEAFEDRGSDAVTEHEESPMPEDQPKPISEEKQDKPADKEIIHLTTKEEVAHETSSQEIEENVAIKVEENKKEQQAVDMSQEEEVTPCDQYCVFDNIKVRYGRGRSSTVYEAKIVDIKKVKGTVQYLVHYPGWNSRFDEWIRCERIEGRSSKPTRKRMVANGQPARGRGRGSVRKSRSQSILPMETNVPSQSALARNGRHERRISLAESMPDSVSRSSKRWKYNRTQSIDGDKEATAAADESKPETPETDSKQTKQEDAASAVDNVDEKAEKVEVETTEKENADVTANNEVESKDANELNQPDVPQSEIFDEVMCESDAVGVDVPDDVKIREAALTLGGLQYTSRHPSPDSCEVATLSQLLTSSSSSDAPTASNGETSHSPDDTSSGSSLRLESNTTPVDVDDSLQLYALSPPEVMKPPAVGRGRRQGGRGRRRGGRRRGPAPKLTRKDSESSHRIHGSMSSCSSSANSDSEELAFSLPDLSVGDFSPNPKYIVDFSNSSYSPNERIDILRTKIDEMRHEYSSLKSEVLNIDRKRKRARKRLRERQRALAGEEVKRET
ncbi:AT-rich interactive domain-containing protein 4B-like isoform X2 [Corticium candelabrum]|uniref:AT-rich interactive domain-containing protein 4B-like isoform X2 n=1 Tax=Corticium candelabrum TaxID=121492 RepID=UPI002E26DB14|nr:AT-rich interactive domain-containing protein 4B-like isoform X2 [Corticium candelabrum]